MSQLVRNAIENLDLESWLEQYVDMKDAGGDMRRIQGCPKCFDDRYKLYVNVEKKLWHCKMCDWGRGTNDIVEFMAAVSDRHETGIRIELAQTVIALPAGNGQDRVRLLFDGDPDAEDLFVTQEVEIPGTPNFNGLTSQSVYQYARMRGLTDEDIEFMGLRSAGRVPTKRGEVPGPWLVFPIRFGATNVAWQGRRLVDGDIKYLSSDNIHNWLWPMNDAFFKRYRQGLVALVEGTFDAWGCLRHALPGLCIFGKTVSDMQIERLKELRPTEVLLMCDADANREVMKTVERVAFNFPRTSVADMTHFSGRKVDAGDALRWPTEVVPWLIHKVQTRMNVSSSEFHQWRTMRR